MKFAKYSLTFLYFCCGFLAIANATELQARFQDWSVFKTDRGDKIICYVASTPIKPGGNYDERGEPLFLVTNIENDADEISVSSGFTYSKKSDVEVSFGSKKFYLFAYQNMSWANDKNQDIDIIKEMQKHDDMVVSGMSSYGESATDSYSLIGFAEAYATMKRICKNPR
jgi:hypothetical protein